MNPKNIHDNKVHDLQARSQSAAIYSLSKIQDYRNRSGEVIKSKIFGQNNGR